MLQVVEGYPYKYRDFKARVRIVQNVEKNDRGVGITIYDECVVVSKFEEDPDE